ncbi:B-cell lymphoma 3 protein-like [Actinia tenebrosa]|uniref:B-cell lymphoma 3 protein-like n=1 Tax=Actinia tenebrosa TaxID=6105 RepID=A0A6P8HYP4_ACTTE|nr:B-cell lymphoma 3 protein-like [Actinia tenebrosa]
MYKDMSNRKLTPRGAPMQREIINPHRAALLNKMEQGKNNLTLDQCDSGLGDSFKSQEGSYERLDQDTANLLDLQDLSIIDEDDEAMKNRHPGPCKSLPVSTPTSCSAQNSSLQISPAEHVMNFAQSNDVRYLLAPMRDDLMMQNEDGDTPLHLAIIHGSPIVESLITIAPNKECLNIYNDLRQTPLHLAVLTKQPAVVNALMRHGAAIDAVDRNGRTPLHLACEQGDMSCIQVLTSPLRCNSGINDEVRDYLVMMLDARDYKGFSALHLAAKGNFVDAVGLLINFGANVDLPDATAGRTAVHHAIEDNNFGMLRVLLFDYKANVNAQRCDESTPLHIAAGRGLLEMSAMLLAAGADLSIPNCENETPLDNATEEVINVLKKYL